MSFQFTVSPDFSPDHISGWYIFNTLLQKLTGEAIHLEMYDNFHTQRAVIENNGIDLIYANPFDAAMLVRDKGFKSLVKPIGESDEAIIAVNVESPFHDVADLYPGTKIALTDDPDVCLIGMMMLESGDLTYRNTEVISCDTYILIVKQLLQGKADVGVFLADAYDNLSNMVKSQLRILVKSEISVIHHSLMIGPRLLHRKDEIQELLVNMDKNDKGKDALKSLGFSSWVGVDEEETEFMIDLMDALSV